jgi:predicted nucleic acid-binding Zn ribbon protein
VIQKFSDPAVESCPKCGSPVRKLLSSPAIQFRGTGWYVTDYANKGRPESGAAVPAGKDAKETASKDSRETREKSPSGSSPASSGSSDSAAPPANPSSSKNS